MFCNFFRSLNPDDAVYCRACGRTIKLPPEQDDDEASQSSTSYARKAITPNISDSAIVAESQIDEAFHRNYAGMDDEELTQLQGAYQKLGVPLPLGLQRELELRVFTEKLKQIESEKSQVSNAATNADDLYSQKSGITAETQADFFDNNDGFAECIDQTIPSQKERFRWWWYLTGGAIVLLLIALGVAFIYGLVWVSAKLYPIAEVLSLLGLVIFLVCLPLSVFKRIRRQCGNGLVGVSYLWGLGLWMYSILCLYDLWGVAGIYVGFLTLGYATVPQRFVCAGGGEQTGSPEISTAGAS